MKISARAKTGLRDTYIYSRLLFPDKRAWYGIPGKMILIMKLTVAFVLIATFHVFAETSYGQKVSIRKQQATLLDVLQTLRKQTGYLYVCDLDMLKKARPVDIHLKKATVEEVLDAALANQSLTYRIVDGTIVITARPAGTPKSPAPERTGPASGAVLKTQPPLRTVSGTVTDEKGIGLPGVNILVKGGRQGTATNADGFFSLDVPEERPVLIFSFVGYVSQEVDTRGTDKLNVKLVPDTRALEELVVVGYSSKQLSQLSSAVATVSGKQLNDVTSNNTLSLLQGKAPGVIVSNASGDPNTTSNVVIRGSGSITAGSAPLIVVDGIIGGNANPNDVESVTILKDAAATGLYGSRAANGVIIITTKSGKSGKTTVSLNATTGFNRATSGNFRVMNSEELYQYEKSFYPADRFDKEIPSSVLSTDTDWRDLAFRTGLTQNYVLTVSGGSEKTRFYISGNYYNEEGTLRFNEAKRYNLRANIGHQINDKLKLNVKFNTRLNKQESDPAGLDGALYGAYNNMPWDSPYNPDGTINRGTEGGWFGREQENFLHGWQYNLNASRTSGIDGDVNLDYTILPDLTFSSYNRVSYASMRSELYHDIRSKAGKGLGRLTNGFTDNLSLITSNRLRYDKSFGKHLVSALLVGEAEKNRIEDNSVTGEGLAPGLHVMSTASRVLTATGGINENAFAKGLLQLDYNFDNRYFAVGSYIRESSSRFGADKRTGHFYTLGASWILSNESFLKGARALDILKIRASYGITGNAEIGNYQSLGLYSFSTQYAGNSGAIPQQLANESLTWEKARSTNLGVDFGVFRRITLNLDLYDKTTEGLLLNVELPYTSGFGSMIRNVGSIRNKGLEVNLHTSNLKGSLTWETGFNIALNRSKVLVLSENKDIRQGNLIISKGQELYTWNMRKWLGVDPQNGDPLWEKVTTGPGGETVRTATNVYSQATLQDVGLASPDFTGGLSNTLSFKRFTLFAFLNFVSGNKVYHTSRGLFDSDGAYYTYNSMVLADGWSRWQQPGDNATHPKPVFGGNKNSNQVSSRYLEDGSYIRLRNVNLSYDLPEAFVNRIKLSQLRLFIAADNLLTFTRFSGMDPEVILGPGGGTSSIKYPVSKKVLFGINLNF